MTFVQRRNRLTMHFSEGIPVVKRHMTVYYCFYKPYSELVVFLSHLQSWQLQWRS